MSLAEAYLGLVSHMRTRNKALIAVGLVALLGVGAAAAQTDGDFADRHPKAHAFLRVIYHIDQVCDDNSTWGDCKQTLRAEFEQRLEERYERCVEEHGQEACDERREAIQERREERRENGDGPPDGPPYGRGPPDEQPGQGPPE